VSTAKYRTVTRVCKALDVAPHVLRYWEREFEIKVKRNSAGRRIYSEEQLEKLRLIKHLVRKEKLTVRGAKRQLARTRTSPVNKASNRETRQALMWVKKELLAIRGLLEPED